MTESTGLFELLMPALDCGIRRIRLLRPSRGIPEDAETKDCCAEKYRSAQMFSKWLPVPAHLFSSIPLSSRSAFSAAQLARGINCCEAEILALHAIGLVSHRRCLLNGIRGGFAGDQARSAAKRQIFESPLDEYENAALKLNDIDQVDEQPHQPGGQPGNVDTKN